MKVLLQWSEQAKYQAKHLSLLGVILLVAGISACSGGGGSGRKGGGNVDTSGLIGSVGVGGTDPDFRALGTSPTQDATETLKEATQSEKASGAIPAATGGQAPAVSAGASGSTSVSSLIEKEGISAESNYGLAYPEGKATDPWPQMTPNSGVQTALSLQYTGEKIYPLHPAVTKAETKNWSVKTLSPYTTRLADQDVPPYDWRMRNGSTTVYPVAGNDPSKIQVAFQNGATAEDKGGERAGRFVMATVDVATGQASDIVQFIPKPFAAYNENLHSTVEEVDGGGLAGFVVDPNGNRYLALASTERGHVGAAPDNVFRPNILKLYKFSPTGTLIYERDLNQPAYTSVPMYGIGNATSDLGGLAIHMNYHDGIILLSMQWHIGYDASINHRHMADGYIAVHADTGKPLIAFASGPKGQYPKAGYPYSSHTFDQKIISDSHGKGFIVMTLGDAYPRGIQLSRFNTYLLKAKSTKDGTQQGHPFAAEISDWLWGPYVNGYASAVPFSYRGSVVPYNINGQEGNNTTLTRLGGVAEMKDGFLLALGLQKQPGVWDDTNNANALLQQPVNIHLLHVIPNFDVREPKVDVNVVDSVGATQTLKPSGVTNKGLIEITHYPDTAQNAERMHIFPLSSDKAIVLWELWKAPQVGGTSEYQDSRVAVVDSKGNKILQAETSIGKHHLPRSDEMRVLDGKLIWFTRKTLDDSSTDPDKGHLMMNVMDLTASTFDDTSVKETEVQF